VLHLDKAVPLPSPRGQGGTTQRNSAFPIIFDPRLHRKM
jgi:hypothetical protein